MAAWAKRTVIIVALLALVAGLTPTASAQSVPAGKEPTVGVVPEVFRPERINRTPLGGDNPSNAEGAATGLTGLSELDGPGEVVERRTEDSRTFVTEDGAFETVLYGGAVNYQDANGDWQPIDNSLVRGASPDVALRNAAAPVEVSLPPVLGAGPVRVADDGISVAFTLQDAKGTPSPGLAKSLPRAASDAAAKASATYANALPGVDVSYTVTAEGVKEDLVLAGPDATTTFDFTVETSAGLTASETAAGGIDFVDGEGTTRAAFAAPFAYDANFESTGAQSAFTEDGVSLSIVETSPELVVRLAADPTWLAAPERVWPVVIDPMLTIGGGAADTYLSKGSPDSNYNTSIRLYVLAGSSIWRTIHAKDIAAFFDEPVTLYSATFQLWATSDTSTQVASPVGLHEMATREWNSGAATWNTRLAPGLRWASPGGDFVAQPTFVNPDVTGAPGWRSWPMTSLAQKWLDGTSLYSGVMLKYENEAAGALLPFASTSESDTSLQPRMVINWEPLEGMRAPYTAEEFDLGAAGQASVNVASGNLALAATDVGIAGTGLAGTVNRFYRSRGAYIASAGARWRMWPQSEERLYDTSVNLALARNGDVAWQGGPDGLLVFSLNANGTFTSPHGYRATLAKNGDGTYGLTFHEDATRYTFYGSGYVKDFTDRNGNTVTFAYTYDAATGEYFMASMTDTQGRVTSFERAGEWKVTKVTDPAGRTHVYAYDRADARANLASYTNPAGGVTRYDYSTTEFGLLSRVTDPNGNATTFTYDSRQRVTALTRATSTWRFDYSTPWQTKVTDPNGNATTHYFDRRGRVTKVIDALGHQRSGTYDANSNVIDRTSAMGNKSTSIFDANNNLTSSKLPTGATTALEYSDAAHKYSATKVTNPQGNASTMTYDTAGNLASVTDSMATPGRSSLTYNPNGTVSSSTDAKGAVTTYGYDAKGNRIRVSPPAPLGATTIAYDGLSRPTTVTDGKGQVTTTAYDALDRPTRVDVGGVVVTSRYDAGGRLVERVDATGTTTYVYDALNRVVEERLPGGRVNAYTYDAAGNLKSVTDATGTVSYGYNAVNLATSVVEPGGFTTTFAYDNDDNRITTTYPNGVTQRAAYDASARLTSIEGTKGTTVLSRFAYTYAASGADTGLRRSVIDKDNETTAYSYDRLDRLVQAKTTSSSGSILDDFRYAWDAVGNRTSETVRQSGLLGASDVTTKATFNAADQLILRGTVSYTYDADGNQTASSAGQALAYNGADQTTSLKRAGGTALPATYAGAGQSQRATAGTTTFTNTLLGVSAGGTTGYTRDPAGALVGIRGANRSYYLFDGLGSVVAVTNANGGVTNSYTYDPFGVTTETKATLTNVANPWRYAGQYFDTTTAMYKMGARYYQPELGRWTQPDPSGLDANAYLYVGGNPPNFIDPTGLATEFGDCFVFRYNNESGSCFGGNFFEVAGDFLNPFASAAKTCSEFVAAGTLAVQEIARQVLKRVIPLGVAAAVACVGGVTITEAIKRAVTEAAE